MPLKQCFSVKIHWFAGVVTTTDLLFLLFTSQIMYYRSLLDMLPGQLLHIPNLMEESAH